MKKKFLLSVFAFVFCLPMMFLATACGDDSPKLNSIELDTTNAKTTFYVGENFVSEGLIVRGVYDDETKTVITDFEINSTQFKKDTAGTYNIFVTADDLTEVYSVTVVVDSVAGISATAKGKYFIGQDFSTNVAVSLLMQSGKQNNITNFTFENFDNTTAGVKTVTVKYLDVSTQINVEVLSNVDYLDYVRENMQSHVVESNNCQGPVVDETEPTATLDFDIQTAMAYLNGGIYAANNGELWHFSSSGKQFWLEFVTNTLYMNDGEITSKKTFTTGFDALKFIVDEGFVDGLSDERSLVFTGLYNPEALYVQLAYADWGTMTSASIEGNELTIVTNGASIKLDYNNWKILEHRPTETLIYSFDEIVSMPDVPQEMVDYDTAVKELSVEVLNKFFAGQDLKTNLNVTATYVNGTSEEATAYSFTGYDKNLVGKQNVTIVYKGHNKVVEVEVLNNEDYTAYVENKLRAHIVSSTNCTIPIDENVEPSAELDFEIKTTSCYMDGNLYAANNHKVWYLNKDGVKYWYDYVTEILYISDGTTYKKIGNIESFDVLKYVSDTAFEKSVASAEFLQDIVHNPNYSFVNFTDIGEVSSLALYNNVLTLNYSDETYVKINYSNWTFTEIKPMSNIRVEFNKTVSIPAISTQEWVDTSIEKLEIEVKNKFFIGQDFKSNVVVTATFTDQSTAEALSYTVSGFDNTVEGVQTVEITYLEVTKTVEVEVVNIAKILEEHIQETNFSTTLAEEPKTTLDFDLGVSVSSLGDATNGSKIVNDGNVWYYVTPTKTFWIDFETHTLYINEGETYTKQTFESNYKAFESVAKDSAISFPPETDEQLAQYAVNMMYSPETCYAGLVSTLEVSSYEGYSLEDGVLTLDLGDDLYAKIDYNTWTLKEFNPSSGLIYTFNADETVVAIPDVEWTVVE